MNPLSDLALDRLIAASSDETLKELIRKAEIKLRNKGEYKIVQRVMIKSIFKNHDITNEQFLEEIEIALRFNIKLLETFPSYTWINIEIIKPMIIKSLFVQSRNPIDYTAILGLSTYLDYSNYLLQQIYQYKDDINAVPLIIDLYQDTILADPLDKVGFSLEESLKLYEILNEVINKINIPEYFDPARLYDYIFYYHDHDYQFVSYVLKDRRDIKLPLEDMHPEMDARIYQVI